jgi:hypothetical protein
VDRRPWRDIGRQLDRLLAELTCLAPMVMVPHAPTESEASTGEAVTQPPGGPYLGASITDARPVVVAGVGG